LTDRRPFGVYHRTPAGLPPKPSGVLPLAHRPTHRGGRN
jgi:hypothetical protein